MIKSQNYLKPKTSEKIIKGKNKRKAKSKLLEVAQHENGKTGINKNIGSG